jgi:formate hydrogenlyase transcriptional activator
MASDSNNHEQLLIDLCRSAGYSREPRAFCVQAAETLRLLTGCAEVRLYPAPGAAALLAPLAAAFNGPAGGSDIFEEEEARVPEVAWVLEHHRPRPGAGPGARALLYLPLVCRGEAVAALCLAARDLNALPRPDLPALEGVCTLLALALDNLTAHARAAELQRFQRENVYLRDEIRTDRDLRLLTGDSPAMKAVRLAVQQVARTDSTVLILGETGTGKELVARALHQLSPRREHLLVAVNCAALAPGVIASELFGHEQGAFTGATKRRLGRFELAHRGTIVLDEIGELPPETQVLLLRVLQERTLERVGGHEPIAVDVRVLSATHQDLEAAMHEGRFRADLYYRLNVFPIRVPPLRERRADIPDLVRHFLHRFGRRLNRPVTQVSPATLDLLTAYPWPGNVRELENLVERALIVTTGDTLEIDPSWLRSAPARGATDDGPAGLAELERRAILDALERCRGKIYGPDGAAAALGLKPTTLYGKMRKHGIQVASGRSL